MNITYREAVVTDIPGMWVVRLSVHENKLSRPDLITDADYRAFLCERGKGWVAESHGKIVGFAVADLLKNNIWALFVQPGYEGKGIGKNLQQMMLDWYFSQGKENVWLSTEPHSRAVKFYRESGWMERGRTENGEVLFSLDRTQWIK
jgi:GNAT superfamily N-acetyltransferase